MSLDFEPLPIAPVRVTDPARFGRVVVLMGGTNSEREVSLESGSNVLAALKSRGIDACAIDGTAALIDAINAGRSAGMQAVDRVFNILHGGDGENGVLQGLLEALGVPYTGSGVLGSALALDKIRTKQVWLSEGLPTPRYIRLAKGRNVHAAARELGLPVIVKPSCEGSSVGVSRVFDDADLESAVALAAGYPGELLMEQMIEAHPDVRGEYSIGVLNGRALASVHILPAGAYYDYHAKYVADDTQCICPGLDDSGEAQARGMAERAYCALGLKGAARIDFMIDAKGAHWLIEANTAPGMTSHSLLPKSAGAFGISYEELCWRMLETSLPGEPATAAALPAMGSGG